MQLLDRCVFVLKSVNVIIYKIYISYKKMGLSIYGYTQTMHYIFMQLKFINNVLNIQKKKLKKKEKLLSF